MADPTLFGVTALDTNCNAKEWHAVIVSIDDADHDIPHYGLQYT